jgi:hypothetical protein
VEWLQVDPHNAYHPESQGAVGRFHQTLQNMRNTLCLDSQQDRDDGVDMLLFAAREAFHESLRCIPFELFFWTLCVRSLLKEKWLCENTVALD